MGLLLAEGRGREDGEDGQPDGHGPVCVCVLRGRRGREGGREAMQQSCNRCNRAATEEGGREGGRVARFSLLLLYVLRLEV